MATPDYKKEFQSLLAWTVENLHEVRHILNVDTSKISGNINVQLVEAQTRGAGMMYQELLFRLLAIPELEIPTGSMVEVTKEGKIIVNGEELVL